MYSNLVEEAGGFDKAVRMLQRGSVYEMEIVLEYLPGM